MTRGSADHAQERLTGADAAWLRVDRPENRVIITSVVGFDRAPDLARLRDELGERLVSGYLRFRSRVVAPVGRSPWFEELQAVDLDHHVRGVTLDAGDDAAVAAWVGTLASESLDPDRPLWELVLGVDPQGRGILVARVHHCIADGISLAHLLLKLGEVEGAGDTVQSPVLRPPRRWRFSLARGWAWLKAAWKIFGTPPDRASRLKGPVGGNKRFAWLPPYPLETLRTQGERLGISVGDLALTALSGALREVLAEAGQIPERLRAVVPFNLRPTGDDGHLENRFGLVLAALPTGAESRAARMAEVVRENRRIKEGAEGPLSYGVLATLGRLPKLAERWVVDFYVSKASAIVTNVPGPQGPFHLAGQKVRDLWVWVPQAGKMGLGVALLSYDGRLFVGFVSDALRLPDPWDLARRFHAEVEALGELGAAGAA